jgi:hypothetical protein
MRQKRPPFLGSARELQRAMAKESLRTNWRLAEASRVNLSEEEIDREIQQLRTIRQRKG